MNASISAVHSIARRITAEDAATNTIRIRHGYPKHAPGFVIPLTGIEIAHKHYPYTVDPDDEVTTIRFSHLDEGQIATIYGSCGNPRCYFRDAQELLFTRHYCEDDFDVMVSISSAYSSGVKEFVSSLYESARIRDTFHPKDRFAASREHQHHDTPQFGHDMWLLDMTDFPDNICKRYLGMLTGIERQEIEGVVADALVFRILH